MQIDLNNVTTSDPGFRRSGRTFDIGDTISAGYTQGQIPFVEHYYPLKDPVNTQWVCLTPGHHDRYCRASTFTVQKRIFPKQNGNESTTANV